MLIFITKIRYIFFVLTNVIHKCEKKFYEYSRQI